MSRYMAWDRGYYESEGRMFPHPEEVHGPFEAADEADLIAQLKAQGIDPDSVRWELDSLSDLGRSEVEAAKRANANASEGDV